MPDRLTEGQRDGAAFLLPAGPTLLSLPYGCPVLICEELFLLLAKDSGSPASSPHVVARGGVAQGLRAAVVADLIAHERVVLETTQDAGKQGAGKGGGSPWVRVIDPAPTGHPVLDQALEDLTIRRGKEALGHTRMFSLIFKGEPNLCPAVAQSLAAAGTVELSRGGLLGRQTMYRVLDPAPREAVRQRLRSVLLGTTSPSPTDRTLLAVLRLLSAERKVLPRQDTGLTRRGLRHRVTEVIGEDPLSSYVARAAWDLTWDLEDDDSGGWGLWFFFLFFPALVALVNQ